MMMSTLAMAESPSSLSTDAIINLPIATIWKLFSSTDGLKDIGYGNVALSLQLNGKYHAERTLQQNQQPEILDGTVSSFDPEHMLSWRWSNNESCWSVLYFNAMGNEMTQIRWLDLCGDAHSADLHMLAAYHRNLFDQLIRRFAPECHVCKEEREASKPR